MIPLFIHILSIYNYKAAPLVFILSTRYFIYLVIIIIIIIII